jgi:hypothetical protein
MENSMGFNLTNPQSLACLRDERNICGAQLSEMRRVLKPSGRLLFVEHGLSPDDKVRRWQEWLNPMWRRVAGGCNLNRAVTQFIEVAGFRIERVDTGYMQGPRPMTFMYEGCARSV